MPRLNPRHLAALALLGYACVADPVHAGTRPRHAVAVRPVAAAWNCAGPVAAAVPARARRVRPSACLA